MKPNHPKTPASAAAGLPFLLCLLSGDAVIAQSVVVPKAYATKVGQVMENIPFAYTPYVRHQQMIDKGLLPIGPIYGHAYRPKRRNQQPRSRDGAWSEFRVILADSTVPLARMQPNYGANLAKNQKEVFKGRITIPHPNPQDPLEFSATVPYSAPFIYLGQNPLVVDLYPQGAGYEGSTACPGSTTGRFMDSVTDTSMRRMIGKGVPCGKWPPNGRASIANGGYVMKFFTAGLLMPYGKGCVSGNGRVPLISSVGTTSLGNNKFALSVTNTPTNSKLAVLVIGLSRLRTATGPLPVDLGITGARGCWQNAPQALTQFVPFNGSVNFPAPIPNDPKIKGLDVFTQFALDDPSRSTFVTTQGGLLHLR